MKERLAGFALMRLTVPRALVGHLKLVWIGNLGPNDRSRTDMRITPPSPFCLRHGTQRKKHRRKKSLWV